MFQGTTVDANTGYSERLNRISITMQAMDFVWLGLPR